MKHFEKRYVGIMIAVLIGLFVASAGTKITYDCPIPANDQSVACVSYEKAVMHPGDLLHNKQDSLVRFIKLFVIFSAVSVMAYGAVSSFLKKKA